jgi:hypothetical protein
MNTDSQIIEATVASTSETQVGTINVPSGRSYRLTGVFAAHAQGGKCRIAIDTYPSLQGSYIQNSTDINSLTYTAAASPSPLNINVNGPAEISAFVTNSAAGSSTARVMLQYIDSGVGSTN